MQVYGFGIRSLHDTNTICFHEWLDALVSHDFYVPSGVDFSSSTFPR